MWIRSIVIALFLLAAYWLSSRFGALRLCFYPTLGAFGYFMISRSLSGKDAATIVAGAVTASAAGSALHAWSPGPAAFLATCLLTMGLIRLIRIHAAPIMAVSLIPFFTPIPAVWTLPVCVLGSLCGLIVALAAAQALESAWTSLRAKAKRDVVYVAEVE
ncbi:hypothetical protein [Paenibacillus flagellatus]|uniref:HPP family protein n=1 Tax=Paenibacillus flagellatus TaxID=2211139 RepID=A0A2V5K035_9BACL|nr:hypothetical protein [Paenibacillus flagellatus]PYI52529.1 hypothetical protein DLM86_20345 [Paenibacillus flagellatus]